MLHTYQIGLYERIDKEYTSVEFTFKLPRMGSSCSSTVHRGFQFDIIDEQKRVVRRKAQKSKELRLIVLPWKQPYESPYTAYSEEEDPFGVSKPRLSWGTEALDREDEEERSNIDGLCGSNLVAFYGM